MLYNLQGNRLFFARHPTPTTNSNMKLTPSTKNAIAKYGIEICMAAFEQHNTHGEGAITVAHSHAILKGNTRMGDAAINAGRELASNQ
jgi:hypothetical protein